MMTHKPTIYRRLNTHEEYQACEKLQQETWGFEDLSVVPGHLLITFQKRGGIVLGAFAGNRLIGFVYGFVGQQPDGAVTHNSVMSAVRPEYRNQGIAYRLKCEQRKLALEQGFPLMTWTFDPLQAPNAHFNLSKLGVLVREYVQDIYGHFRDQINQGLPTDRFAVEWWIDSAWVKRQLDKTVVHKGVLPAAHHPPRMRSDKLLEPSDQPADVADLKRLHLAIPSDIDAVKDQSVELALRWRYYVRDWFETAFAAGFILHGFSLDRDRGIGIYTLSRTKMETILLGES